MATRPAGVRAELHLHSYASKDTGSWFLNRAVIPESYTAPRAAYDIARSKGMDYVALTDHNTLEGVAEIAHLPNVIVGVEVTASFPEDGVLMHVLVWGLDDTQWAEIDRIRSNVYEMTDYLRAEGLPHSLAHPLHRVGSEFRSDHLEKSLLIFSLWEGRNGARPSTNNEVAIRIARSASTDYLAKLADKHDIEPVNDGWIGLTGGSDDHNMFDIANAWTELPSAATTAEVIEHLRAGRTEPGGNHGDNHTLAHSASSVFVKAHLEAGAGAIPWELRGVVSDLVGYDKARLPDEEPPATKGGRGIVADDIMGRLRKNRRLVRRYRQLGRGYKRNERLRLVTGWLHEDLMRQTFDGASGSLEGTLSSRIQSGMGAAAVVFPYFLAASYHRGEFRYTKGIEREFFGDIPGAPPRAVMLTDTYDQLNGVAGTMRRLAAFAAEDPLERITVVTTGDKDESVPGLRRLAAVSSFQMPAYGDPSWRLGIPSIIELLDFVEDRQIDLIHAATPGPAGLAGLLIARALGLPFVATYHTELARYALELSGDRFFASICGRATSWFYGQADRVYVPTESSGRALVGAGIEERRIARFTRGVDTELFDPDRRSDRVRRRLAGRRKDAVVLLYVGRLSREKGVFLLAEAFRQAAAGNPHLVLAIVGEGPGEAELARALEGTPHRFVGPQTGAELAACYASADFFCLPSETETFGQVAAEAAASGLPVVTLDRGAAHERVRDGETGMVVPSADSAALAAAIGRLSADPALRERMGRAARTLALQSLGWGEVFEELAASYADLEHSEVPDLLDMNTPGRDRAQ